MPASTAEVTNAIILYLVTFSPIASAAMRLSRMAMIARPDRLSIRLSTTNRVKSVSAKPMPNVAILFTPVAPAGPLTSSLPATFGLLKAICRHWPSSDIYRQLMTLRMISPNASVTIAR